MVGNKTGYYHIDKAQNPKNNTKLLYFSFENFLKKLKIPQQTSWPPLIQNEDIKLDSFLKNIKNCNNKRFFFKALAILIY